MVTVYESVKDFVGAISKYFSTQPLSVKSIKAERYSKPHPLQPGWIFGDETFALNLLSIKRSKEDVYNIFLEQDYDFGKVCLFTWERIFDRYNKMDSPLLMDYRRFLQDTFTTIILQNYAILRQIYQQYELTVAEYEKAKIKVKSVESDASTFVEPILLAKAKFQFKEESLLYKDEVATRAIPYNTLVECSSLEDLIEILIGNTPLSPEEKVIVKGDTLPIEFIIKHSMGDEKKIVLKNALDRESYLELWNRISSSHIGRVLTDVFGAIIPVYLSSDDSVVPVVKDIDKFLADTAKMVVKNNFNELYEYSLHADYERVCSIIRVTMRSTVRNSNYTILGGDRPQEDSIVSMT